MHKIQSWSWLATFVAWCFPSNYLNVWKQKLNVMVKKKSGHMRNNKVPKILLKAAAGKNTLCILSRDTGEKTDQITVAVPITVKVKINVCTAADCFIFIYQEMNALVLQWDDTNITNTFAPKSCPVQPESSNTGHWAASHVWFDDLLTQIWADRPMDVP